MSKEEFSYDIMRKWVENNDEIIERFKTTLHEEDFVLIETDINHGTEQESKDLKYLNKYLINILKYALLKESDL